MNSTYWVFAIVIDILINSCKRGVLCSGCTSFIYFMNQWHTLMTILIQAKLWGWRSPFSLDHSLCSFLWLPFTTDDIIPFANVYIYISSAPPISLLWHISLKYICVSLVPTYTIFICHLQSSLFYFKRRKFELPTCFSSLNPFMYNLHALTCIASVWWPTRSISTTNLWAIHGSVFALKNLLDYKKIEKRFVLNGNSRVSKFSWKLKFAMSTHSKKFIAKEKYEFRKK